jgi:hypothetical protein
VVRKEGAGWIGQKARVHRTEAGKRLVVGTEGAEWLEGKRRLVVKTEGAEWLGQ